MFTYRRFLQQLQGPEMGVVLSYLGLAAHGDQDVLYVLAKSTLITCSVPHQIHFISAFRPPNLIDPLIRPTCHRYIQRTCLF